MLTDPQSVTYNGSGLTLPRQGASDTSSRYGTADGQFNLEVEHTQYQNAMGQTITKREITLSRNIPDPTDPGIPTSWFPTNAVSIAFHTDEIQTESSVDIPRLQTALLALVDSTFRSRLLGGEM